MLTFSSETYIDLNHGLCQKLIVSSKRAISAPAVNPDLVPACRAEIVTTGPVVGGGLTGLLRVTTGAPVSVLS
jgi:hypothetical protein